MKPGKILLLLLIIGLIAAFFLLGFDDYLNLAFLKEKQAEFNAYYQANQFQTALIFFCTYVLFTALSLPAAGILTLASGAIFGFVIGSVLASAASTVGATLAFLAARYLFRDTIQQRFSDKLKIINEGIEKDGAFYLFTLRLVVIFPFFMINLVMALTPIRTTTFAAVSWVGMLAATMVFVNAGTQLAKITDVGDILSFPLLASFALLGLFPLITKKTVDFVRSRKLATAEGSGDGL